MFLLYSVSRTSALNNKHARLLIAGNLRLAGCHHKAISRRCVADDEKILHRHFVPVGKPADNCEGIAKEQIGTMTTEQHVAAPHRKDQNKLLIQSQ